MKIPIVSVAGWSGTGKTTYLEQLIPELKRRGLRIAALKHDAHNFELDREGKDSWRLSKAGADVTLLVSGQKAAILENRPVSLERLLEGVLLAKEFGLTLLGEADEKTYTVYHDGGESQ